MLHAGFYYTADSLKARFTRDGNRQLTEYCQERGLRVNRCGKLVVAREPTDLAGLGELLRRGRASGVPLEELSLDEARRIEPRVKTCERALFSPTTSSVDPGEVLDSLCRDMHSAGIRVATGTAYVGLAGAEVRTSAGAIAAGYVVNAAGLYADRIARDFSFSERHRILPFKGLYIHAEPGGPRFNTHIYPVPDLRAPFLGVHVTVGVEGEAHIGPTAMPALWREHYQGYATSASPSAWRSSRARRGCSSATTSISAVSRSASCESMASARWWRTPPGWPRESGSRTSSDGGPPASGRSCSMSQPGSSRWTFATRATTDPSMC